MRIFTIFAELILLGQICPARGAVSKRIQCAKLNDRCEVECLTFKVKIGGCRADLTPLCCKQ
nr:beta-defensin 107A-like [Jaculus jaculus]